MQGSLWSDEDDDWYAQSGINAASTGFVYEFLQTLKIGDPGGDIIFNIGVNDADFEDDPTGVISCAGLEKL